MGRELTSREAQVRALSAGAPPAGGSGGRGGKGRWGAGRGVRESCLLGGMQACFPPVAGRRLLLSASTAATE